jgi:hypothetical protein
MIEQEYDYDNLIRSSKKYKTDKEKKYNDSSKERLSSIAKKKIETTMIGALSSIEGHFGFLWGHDNGEELTPEQQHLKSIYDEIRSEILDKGNNQIRNLESELSYYEIKWLRYQMNLPLIPMEIKEEADAQDEED